MNKNQIVGRAIACSAAIFYGFNTTLSRLAYDPGPTPISLSLYRWLASTVLMIVLFLSHWKVPRVSTATTEVS